MFTQRPAFLCRALFLSLTAVWVVSHRAPAQSPAPPPKPFTLNLGEYYEESANDTHFLLGLTYELDKKSQSRLHYGLYADGVFRTSHAYNFETFTIGPSETVYHSHYESSGSSGYGVGVYGRHYLNAPSAALRPYVGLGTGLYSETFDTGPVALYDSLVPEHSQRNGLGGKVIIGVESRFGLTGEFSYTQFPNIDLISLSGYGTTVGCRF